MHILFVVPYPPSLVRVRSYNLIKHLSQRGHHVTVVTLWTTERERADVESLREHCHRVVGVRMSRWRSLWNCLGALPGDVPLQAVYSWQPALAAEIAPLLADVDIVHVEHLRGARYALFAARQCRQRSNGGCTPIVWDSVDCISHLFEQAARESRSLRGRLMTRLELPRTRRYEARLVGQFDRVLVTSQTDKQALERLVEAEAKVGAEDKNGSSYNLPHSLDLNLNLNLAVLPNGVALDYFAPSDEPRVPDTLIFTGKMSYHANVSAAVHLAHDIMPRIWAQRPDVQLWLVGKDPTQEVRALARPTNGYDGGIVVTGTVPDIRPYLRRASVAVAPIPYGTGIQNKVLEAMACATPVVANTRATSALSVRPNRDVVVANTAESFAHAVMELLDAPERRGQLGQSGRTYVQTYHAWDKMAEQLEAMYERELDRVRVPSDR